MRQWSSMPYELMCFGKGTSLLFSNPVVTRYCNYQYCVNTAEIFQHHISVAFQLLVTTAL